MVAIHHIQLHWLTADEGGRKSPVGPGRYAPSARFVSEREIFSVVVDLPGANPTQGTLQMLNHDLVEIQRPMRPGATLELMEESRVVADCVVERSDVAAVAVAGRS